MPFMSRLWTLACRTIRLGNFGPGNRVYSLPPSCNRLPILLQNALILSVRETRNALRMVHNRTANFRSSAEQFFLGSIALASANLAFLRPGIYLASTAFACLIVIVLFALTGSVIVSALLAVISVAGTAPPVNNVVSSLIALSGTSKEND